MRNRPLFLPVIAAMFLAACGPKPVNGVVSVSDPVEATAAPQPTVKPAEVVLQPVSVDTPAPEPPRSFEGYWLELVQDLTPTRSQTLRLLYEKDGVVSEIATFCVKGSFSNTPKGVWFIIEDRSTVYPSVRNYAKHVFPHNFVWRYHDGSNSYLHPAPWNDLGPFGCPILNSHGCINMRPADFDILHDGGVYTNPMTGEVSDIAPITIGMPIVIVPKANTCGTLAGCLKWKHCATGYECFARYTFARGANPTAKWTELKAIAPNLSALDNLDQ